MNNYEQLDLKLQTACIKLDTLAIKSIIKQMREELKDEENNQDS